MALPAASRTPFDAQSAPVARLLRSLNTPWKMRLFFLWRLPSLFFWGVRIRKASPDQTEVLIPFSWRTQNPLCLPVLRAPRSGRPFSEPWTPARGKRSRCFPLAGWKTGPKYAGSNLPGRSRPSAAGNPFSQRFNQGRTTSLLVQLSFPAPS